ncbi:hypothetical protein IC582_001001 [Cucumis melo]
MLNLHIQKPNPYVLSFCSNSSCFISKIKQLHDLLSTKCLARGKSLGKKTT